MKNVGLFLFLGGVLLIMGCNQQTPFQYNEKVVKLQTSLLDSIELVSADTIAKDVFRLERIQEITKRQLNVIKTLESPKSGVALKEAFVADIESLYNYNDVLLQMTKLSENDSAIIPLQDKLVELQLKLEKCDDRLVAEQEKFAKAHSFRLEKK